MGPKFSQTRWNFHYQKKKIFNMHQWLDFEKSLYELENLDQPLVPYFFYFSHEKPYIKLVGIVQNKQA